MKAISHCSNHTFVDAKEVISLLSLDFNQDMINETQLECNKILEYKRLLEFGKCGVNCS